MAVNLKALTIQFIGLFAVLAVALFGSAGTIIWVQGWIFLGLFVGFTLALSFWLMKYNPALVNERMTGIGKPNQPTWDKVFYILINLVFLAWIIVMPLDAVRYHWSYIPAALQVTGMVLLLWSFYLFFLTFRENSYLSPAVRIQSERGQTVVSTGLYRYIRHPMYAAALVFLTGSTLLLGSWYGLGFEILLMLGIAFRATREEQILAAELPGYASYLAKVRYRFIPGIW